MVKAKIKEHLRQVAEILYQNTPSAELTIFETIELSIREHLQETVAPGISNFFFNTAGRKPAGRERKVRALCRKNNNLQPTSNQTRVEKSKVAIKVKW